LNSPAPLRNNP